MANLSQLKRQRMLEFLKKIRDEHKDDDNVLIALGEIESALNAKKYGLVWEQHEETVDIKMRTHVPVFTEVKEREISHAPCDSYNFLLEGDNLHSLKLLEKTHKGKIDVIYIDPPYNTGKTDDFIYDDKIVDQSDAYKHSKWLSFMEKRLLIARELLSDRGLIAISIGYQEVNDLMLLCEEIFSPMQVVSVTVQTSGGKPNGGFNYMQEYVIFVAPTEFLPNESLSAQTEYASPYHAMTLANFNQIQRPNQAYPIFIDIDGNIVGCGDSLAEKIKNGEYTGEKKDYVFDYSVAPSGTVAIYPVTKKGDPCVWRLISSQLLENWKKGYVKVTPQKESKNNKNRYNIQYLAEGVIKKIEAGEFEIARNDSDKPTIDVIGYKTAGANISTIWLDKSFYTTKGSNSITALIGRNAFSYPKPVELIYEILQRTTSENSIVLDFFAGSGTTGQAVLELNMADGGHRKFILCTNNENQICENVTYQRLSKVISGYQVNGKKEIVLFEHKIDISYLKDFDKTTSLLEKIEEIKEKNEEKFNKILTRFDNNILSVIGVLDKDEIVNGIPANLKYYRTDFVSKEEEDLPEALLNHIAEMIQLEYGVKLDGKQYIMVLDDDEADKLALNWDEYFDVKALYVSKNVLFTTEQNSLFKDVEIHIIPDYYFNFELREVGESW